jgi:hypothetical protein
MTTIRIFSLLVLRIVLFLSLPGPRLPSIDWSNMKVLRMVHVQDLAERRSNAYQLLLELEKNPAADERCFQSTGRIVDWIATHPISLEGGTLDQLGSFVRTETADLGGKLQVLLLTLSEASNPGRVRTILMGYPRWLATVSDVARPYFLGILPNLAAHLAVHVDELEGSGIDALIKYFNVCATAEDCEILSECVERYQGVSGSVILAAAELAALSLRTRAEPLIKKLMILLPPGDMRQQGPARELLLELVKLETVATNELTWTAAVGACLAVTGESHLSAAHLARNLGNAMRPLGAQMQAAYLNSLGRILEEIGTSMMGYGLQRLPEILQRDGEEHFLELVEQGIAISHRYGRIAAEEFFRENNHAPREAALLSA